MDTVMFGAKIGIGLVIGIVALVVACWLVVEVLSGVDISQLRKRKCERCGNLVAGRCDTCYLADLQAEADARGKARGPHQASEICGCRRCRELLLDWE